eukprot:8283394-Lingulodinium_polyedra.AAC.1
MANGRAMLDRCSVGGGLQRREARSQRGARRAKVRQSLAHCSNPASAGGAKQPRATAWRARCAAA